MNYNQTGYQTQAAGLTSRSEKLDYYIDKPAQQDYAGAVNRDCEIPGRLESLRSEIKRLCDRVALLRDRTAYISGPTPPTNKGEVGVASRSALGGALAELISEVGLISEIVEDILSALEL